MNSKFFFSMILVVGLTACDSTNGLRPLGRTPVVVFPGLVCLEDTDADGFGDAVSEEGLPSADECPAGTVDQATGNGGDCDDLDRSVNPGADEDCDNGTDDDCDGDVDAEDKDCEEGNTPNENCLNGEDDDDDSAVDNRDSDCGVRLECFADDDGDHYGDDGDIGSVRYGRCDTGDVVNDDDCDDLFASVNPGASEICNNGIDDDCEGGVDEGCGNNNPVSCYRDADADAYGAGTAVSFQGSCPGAYASANGDCDDTVASTHPGAQDLCTDSVDNDCDGTVNDGCASQNQMEVCWTTASNNSDRELNNASGGEIWFTGSASTGTRSGVFTTVCVCGTGTPGQTAEGNVEFTSTDHRMMSNGREKVPSGWSRWWAASSNDGRLTQLGEFYVDYTCDNNRSGSPVAVTIFPSGGGAGARWTNPPR